MLDKLFNSGTRLKILNWFFSHTEEEFFIQELLRGLGTDARNVFTELNYLEKLEILVSRKQGRERFFRVNKKSKYFESLSNLFAVYHKEQSLNKETLDLLVDDYNAYPQILSAAANVGRMNNLLEKFDLASKITTALHSFKENKYTVWVNKKEFRQLSKEISDKIFENDIYINKLLLEFETKEKTLIEFCNYLSTQNLAKLSQNELLKLYQEYYQKFEQFSLLQWLFFEFDENNLISNLLFEKLSQTLESKAYFKKSKVNPEVDLTLLTIYLNSSKAAQEAQSFADLIKFIEGEKNLLDYLATTENRFIIQDLSQLNPKFLKLVREHTQKFGWLSYSYSGPGWDENYYLELVSGVARLISNGKIANLSANLAKNIFQQEAKIQDQAKKLTENYNFDSSEIEILNRVKTILSLGPRCWDGLYYSASVVENLFREIGKRFYLSLKQVRYIYPEEMDLLFKNKGFEVEILNQRYLNSSQFSSVNLQQDKFLEGKENDQLLETFNLVKEEKRAFSLLRGVPVAPGLIFGKVTESDILVLEKENFDFKDQPNIAAIILEDKNPSLDFIALCRFMGIVCVAGVEDATNMLEFGQNVLVDSLHGEVVIS